MPVVVQHRIPWLNKSDQIIFAIFYSFLEKRTNRCKECCGGRPAIAIPINLLDDFHHRWAYACAFGAITNTIVIIFFGIGSYITFPDNLWASVFAGLLVAFEVCVNFCPFFICISSRRMTFGNLVGLLYALFWLSIFVSILIECANPIPNTLPYIGLVIQVPSLCCLGVLIIRFAVMLIWAFIKCSKSSEDKNECHIKIASEWQRNYVNDLMIDNPVRKEKEYNQGLSCWGKFKFWWDKYIWSSRPNFQYSTRIVCTIFVVFCCTYQIGVVYFWLNTVFVKWYSDAMKNYLNYTGVEANSSLANSVNFAADMIEVFWNVVTVISALLFAINILLITGRYRWHMLRLYKGDKSFMPAAFLNNVKSDSAEIVRSCMMFSGYQIAYMIWGMFIVNFVLWVLALLMVFIILLPLLNGVTVVVQWLAEVLIIPTVMNFFLRLIQKVMARRAFLQNKMDPKDNNQPLAIDNLRGFHVFNYLFFLANIQTGLFSCLYRILIGFVFGLVFLGRMDRCVLMERLEGSDKGYMAYLGMMYMEKTHNNPVMRTFCQLLVDFIEGKKCPALSKPASYGSTAVCDHHKDIDPEALHKPAMELKETSKLTEDKWPTLKLSFPERSYNTSSKAFKRWHLVYTLIHNPVLVAERRQSSPEENQDEILAEQAAHRALSQSNYEQYMKLRQQLSAIEIQIYGKPVKREKRKSMACQTLLDGSDSEGDQDELCEGTSSKEIMGERMEVVDIEETVSLSELPKDASGSLTQF